jgi:SAM-dependent methyltransferase
MPAVIQNRFEHKYFSGSRLYGDDFREDQINTWFREEERGYFDLVQSYKQYIYSYHALNEFHAFRFLKGHYNRCLALGCAKGDDVAPLASRVDKFIAIEPAEKWWSNEINGTAAEYLKPSLLGDIPLPDASIALAVCSGVLHHIPNASHVLSEIARVLRPRGHLVMREPISTMGDWRKPRRGLTANERGFPPEWIDAQAASVGLRVVRKRYCFFPLVPRFERLLGLKPVYNSRFFVRLDYIFSLLTKWNLHYHRDAVWKKIAPGAIFYTFEKT